MSKLVTDLDVVAHDYSVNFDHHQVYAECKGGKHKSTLDRVVWVRGVKELIAADYAHLVLDHCDDVTVEFARTHRVEILQKTALEALETSFRIPTDFWPGRSNLAAYEETERQIQRLRSNVATNSLAAWIVRSAEIWRESFALALSYARLNSLLRLFDELKEVLETVTVSETELRLVRYGVSALLVRLSQYVLFAAADTLSMTPTTREKYLAERLTAGNLTLGQSKQILDSAFKLARSQLEAKGVEAPAGWTSDQMLSPPRYAAPFAQVIERVIAEADRSRLLPLTMELRLYGFCGNAGTSLVRRAEYGLPTSSVVMAFARQSLGLTEQVSKGAACDFDGLKKLGAGDSRKDA
ncbi:MAG TPA: hypothetical protein VMY37_16840 [Thermoguttaceae bacterium]|nr:hypothetical protein [Thermoguttaceae bacterium]